MPTLKEHLLALSTGAVQPYYRDEGICQELQWREYFRSFSAASKWVGENLTDWEFYSGDTRYPVPSPHYVGNPSWAYAEAAYKWADDTYSDLRRKACAYLAGKCDA